MSVPTTVFTEKSGVGSDFGDIWVFELVGGLGLEGHSVGGQDGPNHVPDLLGDVHFNVVPGVLRGWWGQWSQLLAAPR
jgi:hypothetical protein